MRIILIFKLCIVLTVFLGFSTASFAQVTVDNVFVHLQAGSRPVHNVNVGNGSSETAYVLVEVEAVLDPAHYMAKSEPSTELPVSPKAFSIEPKGQRTVRLLLKSAPTDKERVFRVAFIPQDRGFGQEFTQSAGGRTATIRVLTGMGILVFADPMKPETAFEWERNGNKIIFKNTGNIQVQLSNGKSCESEESCTELPSKRIYAGATYEVTTPSQNTVSYLRKDGASGGYEKVEIAGVGN